MAVIVIMGVSGAGKSVVGARLAEQLEVPFCEGDNLHSAGAIAKMTAGLPLDDADRAPRLARIASWIVGHSAGGVVSCSALRRRYRDRLRENQVRPPIFVLLNPPRVVLERRLSARVDHFMPASSLDTQLKTLELPFPGEHVLSLEEDTSVAALVDETVTRLQLATAEQGCWPEADAVETEDAAKNTTPFSAALRNDVRSITLVSYGCRTHARPESP